MREFEPLPVAGRNGFPQSFPLLFRGKNYRFSVYVNVAADVLPRDGGALPVPDQRAFVVARVERVEFDGALRTILLRKVLPNVEYVAGDIALRFPELRVVRENLNGRGDYGS